ncbi:Zinc finger CCCH domain-containing protein isoform 1 [Schistosoma japonicum]|uniref:Zinc finger CCCH domain-containing protein isoform 1 n=1 Tax=Schistosoma japonicum TaxID=6182 RepID=A0A4Z2DM04_SCHJA|nr:Zinc finger CCCH domain-containing protein isoform 1 [Schistosoma japonicum]
MTDVHHRSLKWSAWRSNNSKVYNCQSRYKYVKKIPPSCCVPVSSLKWNKYTCPRKGELASSACASSLKRDPSGMHSYPNKIQSYISNSERFRLYKFDRKLSKSLISCCGATQPTDKMCSIKLPSDRINRPSDRHAHMPHYSSRIVCSKRSQFRYVKPSSSAISSSAIKDDLKIITKFSIRKVKQHNMSRPSAALYKKIVRRAVCSLKFRRRAVCQSYCRTGYCSSKQCSYSHDKNYLRICPRFLQQNCALGSDSCPLAHVLDPCRLPQCTYFESGNCERAHCPYLHVKHHFKTVICPDFARGRCPLGRLCNKRHIWIQKSFSSKSGRHKLSKLTIAVGFASKIQSSNLEDKSDRNYSSPIGAPDGSLRNVYPAPEFIPLIPDTDDSITDTSSL